MVRYVRGLVFTGLAVLIVSCGSCPLTPKRVLRDSFWVLSQTLPMP